GPQVEHDVFELALVLQISEDLADLAHDQLEHVDLAVEHLEDMVLDGPGSGEVEDPHRLRLADAVDTADALLDPHRIPGQVVVDDRVAELEVASLAADVGREQNAPVASERGDLGILLRRGERSV